MGCSYLYIIYNINYATQIYFGCLFVVKNSMKTKMKRTSDYLHACSFLFFCESMMRPTELSPSLR